MKKIFLLLVLFFALVSLAQAQTVTCVPGSTSASTPGVVTNNRACPVAGQGRYRLEVTHSLSAVCAGGFGRLSSVVPAGTLDNHTGTAASHSHTFYFVGLSGGLNETADTSGCGSGNVTMISTELRGYRAPHFVKSGGF